MEEHAAQAFVAPEARVDRGRAVEERASRHHPAHGIVRHALALEAPASLRSDERNADQAAAGRDTDLVRRLVVIERVGQPY